MQHGGAIWIKNQVLDFIAVNSYFMLVNTLSESQSVSVNSLMDKDTSMHRLGVCGVMVKGLFDGESSRLDCWMKNQADWELCSITVYLLLDVLQSGSEQLVE